MDDYMDEFIQNRKPGPQGQVRDDWLCHGSFLVLVSGFRCRQIPNPGYLFECGRRTTAVK